MARALLILSLLCWSCDDGSCPSGTTKVGGSCVDLADAGSDAGLDSGPPDVGADSTDAPDVIPPLVVETTPADLSVDVGLDITIRVVFSEEIDSATLTDMSFRVRDGMRELAGVVSWEESTLTAVFTPASPLALVAEYTAELSTTISDLAGNNLEAEHRWTFTTREGVWADAERLETRIGPADGVSVAIDADVVAAWQQDDGVRDDLWFNRFDPTAGWGAAELLEEDPESAFGVRLVSRPGGGILALWAQAGIRTSALDVGGWEPSQRISSSENVGLPQLGLASDGTGTATWLEFSGGAWSSSFDPTSGWTADEEISAAGAGGGLAADLQVDSEGNAIAVWEQHDGARFNVAANRAVAGAWGSPELIETASGDARLPSVVTSPDGDSTAVWVQLQGTFDIWSARHSPGSGWTSPERVQTSTRNAFSPVMAAEPDGSVMAAWRLDGPDEVWVSRYVSGWSAPERIGAGTGARVVVDVRGNVMLVWRQNDGTRTNLLVSRRDDAGSWGAPVLVERIDASVRSFDVAVDEHGRAWVVFIAEDTVTDVWATRLE